MRAGTKSPRDVAWVAALAVMAVLWTSAVSAAERTVRVGAYEYALSFKRSAGKPVGVIPDLIKALSQASPSFEFQLVETASRRRYDDFDAGMYDMMLLENPAWGWRDRPVLTSKALYRMSEIYVARADAGRDDRYFDTLSTKRLALVLGFHYGFLGQESDPDVIRRSYDAVFSYNEDAVLERVLNGDADIGIVSELALSTFLRSRPFAEPRLVVGPMPDQTYDLPALMRSGIGLVPSDVDRLIDQLAANGVLDRIWRRWVTS